MNQEKQRSWHQSAGSNKVESSAASFGAEEEYFGLRASAVEPRSVSCNQVGMGKGDLSTKPCRRDGGVEPSSLTQGTECRSQREASKSRVEVCNETNTIFSPLPSATSSRSKQVSVANFPACSSHDEANPPKATSWRRLGPLQSFRRREIAARC